MPRGPGRETVAVAVKSVDELPAAAVAVWVPAVGPNTQEAVAIPSELLAPFPEIDPALADQVIA